MDVDDASGKTRLLLLVMLAPKELFAAFFCLDQGMVIKGEHGVKSSLLL